MGLTTAGGQSQDRLMSASLALGMNVVLTSGLGALAWVAAARLMPTDELAQDLALVAGMVAIASVAELGGTVTLPRFLPVLGPASSRAIRQTYVGTSAVGALLALGFVLVAPRMTDSYRFLGEQPGLQVLFVLAVCASTIFTLQDAVLIAFRAARWVTVQNALFAGGKLLLFVGAVAAGVPHPFFVTWVLALLLAVPAVNVLLVPGLLPRGGPGATLTHSEMSRFALHASGTVVVAHVSTTFLPVVVFAAAGPIQGAYFAIAFTFAVALENLAVGLGIALTVEGSYDERQLRSLLHRALTTGMPIMLLVCTGTALAAPLLLFAFGADYASGATTVLRLLAVGALPQAIVHLYVAAARVRQQSGRIMALQITLSVLVFASVLALLAPLGLEGVGIGWVVAHCAVAALVLPALLRGVRTPHDVLDTGPTGVSA